MIAQTRAFTLLILIGIFLATSCSDSSTSSSDEPPTLPPVSSMQMDFSTFNEQQASAQKLKGTNGSNFQEAAVQALFLKTTVDFNLILPRILLNAASDTDAELTGDGEWEWSYNNTFQDEQYGVRFTASRNNDTITWKMYVTNSIINVEDQLLFEGTTNGNGTEGTWRYYSALENDSQEATSETEWSVNGEDDASLTLTVLTDRNDRGGDTIDYSFDGTVKTLIYTNTADNETTEIVWNSETKVGYIISPDYNNGEQACWNANFEDVQCTEIDV